MTVFVLPPRLSWSSLVNLESLYGTCWLFPSTNALITFPSALSDKLIFCAYLSLSPVTPVLHILSLPARSTRLSLDATYLSSPFSPFSINYMFRVNMLWDRDESLFMSVSPTDRLALPISINLINSSYVLAVFTERSLIKMPLSGLSFTSNLALVSWLNKSCISSL